VDENPVADDIVGSIGDLSLRGVERAEEGEFDALARLMDMNHGSSTRSASRRRRSHA